MKLHYDAVLNEPFAYAYLSNVEKGEYIALAEGMYAECAAMDIEYDEEVKLFQCGRICRGWNDDSVAGFVSAPGLYCNAEAMAKKRKAFPEYADFFDAVEKVLGPKDMDHLLCNAFTHEEHVASENGTCWGGTWAGHTVPDFGGLLELGTSGLRAKINRYRSTNPYSAEFYDALERVLDGFDLIGERVKAEAEKRAAEAADEGEKNHFLAIARAMETCPQNTPYDFLSASQFFWIFFSYDGYDSPGRLDQIFLPYWKKTPYDEAFAILDGMWIGFHQHRTWNVCISGSDENGNDTTNEISFAFLELVKKHRFQTPNLTMRCHENTDPALMRSAAEAIGAGCGLPTLYNDRAVCRMFMDELGIPPKDAHNYAMNGCNQIDIQGRSHMGLEDGEVNLCKCVELMLNRGVCTYTGEKIGFDCGDPLTFTTFDEVLAAFKKEVEYITDMACRMSNKSQKVHADNSPNLWRSLMIQGCIEKGRDFKAGGPIYNHGQILAEGLADAVDSLAAMRYHVFEQKNFTMAELLDGMDKDFEDNEVMRRMLSEKPVRFGNGDPDTDALAREVVEHYFRHLLTIPTYRGGWYTGGCSPFIRAAGYGRNTGACPNGRHKFEPMFADSIGATPGRDEEGPTALLNSALQLPHELAGSGFILNIKFDKDVFNTEEGMENFLAIWKTYFENGGQQLSVTVVSQEELLDAKVHPENHRDLIVRVGGYSDYFVNISADLQDNVIARTGYRS
ncbi:MAG: hypothetical protein E7658_00690 [Ruminococcaceae bacterium]|nr:hypothetical protein [Oscillospiraceae bacterium]